MKKQEKNNKFVHLHVHSHYSLLDGLSSIKGIVSKAKQYGQDAVALTDHGNLFGSVEFYKECQKQGIKSILGCEFYLMEDIAKSKENKERKTYHLTVLAMNNEGWKNIIRLVSKSNNKENFYYKPLIDFGLLKKYSDGLIVLSGCMAGIVSQAILNNENDKALKYAQWLNDIFDDRLYFETQNNGIDGQYKINEEIRKIAKKIGRKCVATVDSHYLTREDSIAHIELKVMDYKNREAVLSSGFGLSSEFYFKDYNEIDLPFEERNNTVEVAERCNVEINLKERRYPSYIFTDEDKKIIGNNENPSEFLLREKLKIGWEEKLTLKKKKNKIYKDRCINELNVILKAGFADYFLIISDIVNWAKQNGIWVGPSRGSAAGSLLLYLLGVTAIDPIENNLIFERFYNAGREGSAPDVDVDIELRYRKQVIEYIKRRFGINRVFQLATFGTMAARAVLKDLMRFNDIDFEEANRITDYIPAKNDDHTQISLSEALEKSFELKSYSEDEKYKKCFEFAKIIEGTPKAIGTHAAAVIILGEDIDNGTIPLVRSPDGQDLLCAWDMESIDSLSILKCDILGLKTLELLHLCSDFISERYNKKIDVFDLYKLPLDDKKSYDLICSGNTNGIFQLETPLGKKWCKNILPRSIEDISDLISLIRPGPSDSGLLDTYLKIRFGQGETSYIHNSLKSILENTNGIITYQEQVINICNKVAKMNLVDSDSFRKAVGKKKPEELKKWKERFINDCINNSNLTAEEATNIWNNIEPHAGYSFNYSHAYAYSLIGYWTAYFKANYTLEFFTSCLICSRYDQKPLDEIWKFVNDAKLFDIKVLSPDLRLKNIDFAIDKNNNIRFGLSYIKGIGQSAIDILVNENIEYSTFYDFIFGSKLNKRIIEGLICSGALDYYGLLRYKMLNEFSLYDRLSIKQKELVQNFFDRSILNTVAFISSEDSIEIIKNKGFRASSKPTRSKLIALVNEFKGKEILSNLNISDLEKEYLGIIISNRPIGRDKEIIPLINVKKGLTKFKNNVSVVGYILEIKDFITKKTKKKMAFLTIEDNTYALDNIVIFPKVFDKFCNTLSINRLVKIDGKLENNSFIANKITSLG